MREACMYCAVADIIIITVMIGSLEEKNEVRFKGRVVMAFAHSHTFQKLVVR